MAFKKKWVHFPPPSPQISKGPVSRFADRAFAFGGSFI
jgi:hypothetical protein